MSRWGKIGWSVCTISFAVLMGTRFVLTGWDPALILPLSLFMGSLIFSLAVDIRWYIDFFTMRTTKYGLNMGMIVILFFIGLVSINFISVRHKMSWDMTKEKVNSLSESTLKLLNRLDTEIKITVFYLGIEARTAKLDLKELLQKYKNHSHHLKVEFVDAYVYKMRAHEYLGDNPSGLTLFAERGTQKVEVSAPIDEGKLTSALIKITRQEIKKVYFLTGHGERSIESGQGEGLRSLAQALRKLSFEVETLNLFDTKIVPMDTDVLVIAGPRSPYILSELEGIEKFLKRGGALMVAVDPPNKRHQLGEWLKKWGVGLKDNLVISPFLVLSGRGQTATAGRIYEETHEITKKFNFDTLTIFDWASELEELESHPFKEREFVELVKTDGNALSMTLERQAISKKARQRTIAISLKGKHPFGDEFKLLVFGDSDFLSEKDIIHYANRKLALNSIFYLAGEEDILNITPHTWTNTPVGITPYQMRGVFLGGFAIPLFMLLLVGIFFYRQRNL